MLNQGTCIHYSQSSDSSISLDPWACWMSFLTQPFPLIQAVDRQLGRLVRPQWLSHPRTLEHVCRRRRERTPNSCDQWTTRSITCTTSSAHVYFPSPGETSKNMSSPTHSKMFFSQCPYISMMAGGRKQSLYGVTV